MTAFFIFGLFVVFAYLVVTLSCVALLLNSVFGGLDFPTSALAQRKIVKIIKDHTGGVGILYDLGSAHGILAQNFQNIFPKLLVYGIDNSSFRIFWSRLKSIFLKNHPKFLTEDLFKTDISKADVIYVYLPKELMPELEFKLQHEMKSKALVITNSVFFPTWKPQETFVIHPENFNFEKIFVYAKE